MRNRRVEPDSPQSMISGGGTSKPSTRLQPRITVPSEEASAFRVRMHRRVAWMSWDKLHIGQAAHPVGQGGGDDQPVGLAFGGGRRNRPP